MRHKPGTGAAGRHRCWNPARLPGFVATRASWQETGSQRAAARLRLGWAARQQCPVTLSLGAFVLGALDPAEHAEVARHVKTCLNCAAEAATLARTARML